MAKIYRSFSEFRSENRAIFKFLSKSDGRGLHEAIWDSRNPEVEELKSKIEELEKSLENERKQALSQEQELHQLRSTMFDSSGKPSE